MLHCPLHVDKCFIFDAICIICLSCFKFINRFINCKKLYFISSKFEFKNIKRFICDLPILKFHDSNIYQEIVFYIFLNRWQEKEIMWMLIKFVPKWLKILDLNIKKRKIIFHSYTQIYIKIHILFL